MPASTTHRRIAEVPDSNYKQEIIDKINRYYKPFKTKRMKKLIILFIAALLPVVATAADTVSDSPPLTKKEQRRTLRGYKGFVELGMGATRHDLIWINGEKSECHKPRGFGIEVLTTHGFQFNNFFFLGGGVGINECTETNVMVPIFGDLRVNIINKRISPVFDAKCGYAVGDHYGVYFSFNAGVRFGFKRNPKSAIYTMFEVSYIEDTEIIDSSDCLRYFLKIGYEF